MLLTKLKNTKFVRHKRRNNIFGGYIQLNLMAVIQSIHYIKQHPFRPAPYK